MRYAILSDVHGNLEALRAVLADCRPDVDGVLCLGDLVGYGADPDACVDILAGQAATLVAGNHEHVVAGLLSLDWFSPHARAAAEWTRERLDADQRAYLGALPLVTHIEDATLVHASPSRLEDWDYLVTREEGLEAAYAVWDTEAGHVTIRRVAYDSRATRRKIVAAGLPRFLADRLAHGA